MKAFLTLATLLSVFSIAFAQCNDNIKAMTGFNSTRFGGKWFIQKVGNIESFCNYGSCAYINAKINGNVGAGAISAVIGFSAANLALNFNVDADGTIKTKLNNTKIITGISATGNIWLRVLDTDYSNYTTVYACGNIVASSFITTDTPFQAYFIGSRTRTISDNSLNAAKKLFPETVKNCTITQSILCTN